MQKQHRLRTCVLSALEKALEPLRHEEHLLARALTQIGQGEENQNTLSASRLLSIRRRALDDIYLAVSSSDVTGVPQRIAVIQCFDAEAEAMTAQELQVRKQADEAFLAIVEMAVKDALTARTEHSSS